MELAFGEGHNPQHRGEFLLAWFHLSPLQDLQHCFLQSVTGNFTAGDLKDKEQIRNLKGSAELITLDRLQKSAEIAKQQQW